MRRFLGILNQFRIYKIMLNKLVTPILVVEEHMPLVNMLQCSLKAGDSDFQLASEKFLNMCSKSRLSPPPNVQSGF